MSHRYHVGDWQLHNRTGPDLVFPTNSVVAHNSVFPKPSRSLIWEYLSWLLRKGATKRETSFSFPSLSALDLHWFLSSPIRNLRSLQLTAALRRESVRLGKACGWERFSKSSFYLANIIICDFDFEEALIQGKTLLFRLEENVLFYRQFSSSLPAGSYPGYQRFFTRTWQDASVSAVDLLPKMETTIMARPKPETAHEKPLATWVTSSHLTLVFHWHDS